MPTVGDVSGEGKDERQQRMEMCSAEDEFILHMQLRKKKQNAKPLALG